MPQSPELDSAVHQGHELDSSAQASPIYEAECPVYEMDANGRQSRTMTSPISFLSSRSDETMVHQRQQSDPVSFTTEGSDAAAKRPVRINNAIDGGAHFADTRALRCREEDPAEEAGAVFS